MDRALKERIIGAIVLVVLVILVVPVFLDGPPADSEVRSERVPLPGQDEQKVQTVVLDRNRTEPVPSPGGSTAPDVPEPVPQKPQAESDPEPSAESAGADTTSQPDEPAVESEPAAAIAEPDREPAAEKVPPPKPVTETAATSSTGMFAVQLGSFSSKENAEKLAAELRKQGFAAFLSQLDTGSGQLHRVRVGPQKDRQAAEAMASRLQKAGHNGQVVPHP
jgi:DedD protein